MGVALPILFARPRIRNEQTKKKIETDNMRNLFSPHEQCSRRQVGLMNQKLEYGLLSLNSDDSISYPGHYNDATAKRNYWGPPNVMKNN